MGLFSFLKDHPFSVEAFFESSTVFTYAVPKQQLEQLIPECLELDIFGDELGFVAAAMVQTKALRPRGFPRMLGNDFFLIGYRVFVRFTDMKGRRMRGLYILGSATDNKRMEYWGNIFTHYNYSTTDIVQTSRDGITEISSEASRFMVRFSDRTDDFPLPVGSPFATWKEARKFAGPLPFTFTYEPGDKSILVIEGVRQNWKPEPLNVLDHSFGFFEGLGLNDMRLANAFMIRNVPYYWKRGRRVELA